MSGIEMRMMPSEAVRSESAHWAATLVDKWGGLVLFMGIYFL